MLFKVCNALKAFHSHSLIRRTGRIHFCLEYSSLDTASRVAIWNTFLSRATDRKDLTVALSEEGVRSLAEEQLNGRQVSISFLATMMVIRANYDVLADQKHHGNVPDRRKAKK